MTSTMSDTHAPALTPAVTTTAEVAPQRFLVVDDHRTFAELLAGALTVAGMECVGTAATADQAVAATVLLQPDVVVMDVGLPGKDGLWATRQIRERCPGVVVAVLTAFHDPVWVVRAAQAGASAFAPKDGSLTELLDVLRRVQPGQMTVAPSAFGARSSESASERQPTCPVLTPREHDVLACLGRGLPVKSVARVLGISVETCRGYVKALHVKLDANSQLEVVVRAQELGLLVPLPRK